MADSQGLLQAGDSTLPPHTARVRSGLWRTLALLAAVALAAHLFLFLPLPLILRAVAGLTLLLLPGFLAAQLWLSGTRPTWVERLALGLGLGTAMLVLLGLALAYLPGPLDRTLVLVGFDLSLILVGGGWWMVGARGSLPNPSPEQGEASGSPFPPREGGRGVGSRGLSLLFLLPLLLAGAFRFTHLGYAEFQGDEARAMLMAAGLGQGRDEVLFVHKKGPGEVLLPALVWATAGGIDEATARLPFALAGLGVVLAVGALGMALEASPPVLGEGPGVRSVIVGLVASLALAVDGYLVAFGRIVQYQSVVALMSILGVWCAWRYFRGEAGRWAVLGAALVAVGTLAHYEAVFALLPMAWLIGRRLWRERRVGGGWWANPAWWTVGGGASIAFAGVAAFFYLPFALHPHFAATIAYILDRRVRGGGASGGGPLYNNLPDYFARATFYNSTWHIILMALALAGALAWWAYHTRVGRWRWLAVAWPFVGLAIVAVGGDWLQVGRLNLAILLFLPWLTWLVMPALSDVARASLLWFLAPFFVAAFLVQKPHTHFYTMLPGWALLLGLGSSEWGGQRWNTLTTRRGGVTRHPSLVPLSLAGLAVVVLVLQVGYLWLAFVDHTPEYKRVYPAARSPLYPVVYGDQPPRGGYFGFPYRAGWGVVSSLFANGTLQGSYDSNEESLITGWYTRGAARCVSNPRYYIVAENVQDEEKIPLAQIQRDYHLLASVDVDGGQKLRILTRDPVAQPIHYTLADSVRLNVTEGVGFPLGQALAEAVPAVKTDAVFGSIRLLGYELSSPVAAPGGRVGLTLFWQAVDRPASDLTVFTHIEDTRIWGQNDSYPQCGSRPTSKWQPGDLVVETRDLRLDSATPAGDYPIRVGLYDAATGQRAAASGADTADGDHATLGVVTVRP